MSEAGRGQGNQGSGPGGIRQDRQAVRRGAGRASCCGPSCPTRAVTVVVKHDQCRQAAIAALRGQNWSSTPRPQFRLTTAAEELTGLPESVTGMSLGCGNPTAIAELRPGEVVLDLGAGGGIDCFLAARQVGPEGRVIGLDMTPEMVRLARRNAKELGVENVDFRYGEMEEMPLPDRSVDVIISNCVINLSPDKDAVFGEAFRVLRPGGRMSISDIVVDGELPQAIRSRLDAWAGCIAGALDEADYLSRIRAAGFEGVEIRTRDFLDLGNGNGWEDAEVILDEAGLTAADLGRKVASIKVTATKPH